jgi:hypothetical protein
MTTAETAWTGWECGECNRKEGPDQHIRSVCHHCGKPLCDEHSVRIDDDAYSALWGPAGIVANHCSDCRARHHPRAPRTGRAAP